VQEEEEVVGMNRHYVVEVEVGVGVVEEGENRV
jgi:hypothetical protein